MGEFYVLDVPGDESYFDVSQAHIAQQDAAGIILCYDVSDKESLQALRTWMGIWRAFDKSRPQHNGRLPVAVVAMKIDLTNRRVVTQKQGEGLVQKLQSQSGAKNCKYLEVSVKRQNTVSDVFNWLTDKIDELNSNSNTSSVLVDLL